MALAATQFTAVRRYGLSPGRWTVTGTFTGPASYTSGGELLTNAILKAALGLRSLIFIDFTPAIPAAGTTATEFAFDHTPVTPGTDQGKIHAYAGGGGAHTHSFLAKGGQAAAGTDALSIKGTTPVTIGKEAATDATNIGGVGGGVQAVTATTAASEIAGTTDLSTFICHFRAEGS